ncbi:MAG: hypothetical protein P1U89_03165 [Verrucomicrobiales bacterium]|nr:hypothetical protein [Verrucomicrobiales bacterium]
MLQLSATLLGVVIAGVCFLENVQGQVNPEVAEMRAALKFTQQKLAQSEAQRKELMKSLAESVRVSEEQTFAAQEIQEKMEAFGVDLFSSSKDSLEQRLLKAVRDLDIMRQENERQRKAVHELSEAFLKYLAATPDAKENIRGEAQESIAEAGKTLNELVDPSQEYVKRLEKSEVVSVDSNWLVVLDAGRKSGVLVGTPIVIERDEKPLYTALIVDVRDTISGAVLQDKIGDAGAVKVGDQIRPWATETDL